MLAKAAEMGYDEKNGKGVGSLAYQILHPRDTKIEGVLFDMDGVILDSEKLYAKFWAAGCAFYGYELAAGTGKAQPQRRGGAGLSQQPFWPGHCLQSGSCQAH